MAYENSYKFVQFINLRIKYTYLVIMAGSENNSKRSFNWPLPKVDIMVMFLHLFLYRLFIAIFLEIGALNFFIVHFVVCYNLKVPSLYHWWYWFAFFVSFVIGRFEYYPYKFISFRNYLGFTQHKFVQFLHFYVSLKL